MGEPAQPTEVERAEALAIAERVLDAIRNDEEQPSLSTTDVWLLAATLKHQAETIASFVDSLQWGRHH